jgi:signal recognition particle receptor subunit beta
MGIGRKSADGREISLKIVYWGPEQAGKTENIVQLNKLLGNSGRLVTLVGEDGFTVYFDFLNPVITLKNGCKVNYLLFAAPGRDAFKLSRELVIQGTDGIVFVVDSDLNRLEDNRKSLSELLDLLSEHKKNFGEIPVVVQYNKRDLPTAMSVEELRRELNLENYPYIEAETIRGVGVVETFELISRESLKNFVKKAGLSDFLCSV